MSSFAKQSSWCERLCKPKSSLYAISLLMLPLVCLYIKTIMQIHIMGQSVLQLLSECCDMLQIFLQTVWNDEQLWFFRKWNCWKPTPCSASWKLHCWSNMTSVHDPYAVKVYIFSKFTYEDDKCNWYTGIIHIFYL